MKYLGYLLIAILVYFAIFWNLDYMPLRLWDESRLAINALEMYENGNYFVTYFNGLPDMWNTKPPLLIWLQVLMFKTFGISLLSFRLPSAIAAFFTILTILVFSSKYFKSFWFGFIAVFILLSMEGYIDFHLVRTGEYDSLLTLFTTLSGLLYFSYIETKKNRFLVLFFVFLMLAVLTKGIAALLFLPGLLLYTLWKKQVIAILTNKYFYIGILIFIIPVLTIYLLRDAYNQGYLMTVYNNEVGGRYITEKYNHNFLYYFKRLTRNKLVPWYILLPVSIAFGLMSENKKDKTLTVFLTALIFPFLAIISFSSTKNFWYFVPAFPFIAILLTIFLYRLFVSIGKKEWVKYSLINKLIPLLFIFSVGGIPFLKVVKRNWRPQDYLYEKRAFDMEVYLQNPRNSLDGFTIVYTGYRPQLEFYQRLLNKRGISIKFKDWYRLEKGDKVLAIQQRDKENIEKRYDFIKTYIKGDLIIYQIE